MKTALLLPLCLLWVAGAAAQDSLPNQPAGVEDFRLDKPAPPPEAKPAELPPATPPGPTARPSTPPRSTSVPAPSPTPDAREETSPPRPSPAPVRESSAQRAEPSPPANAGSAAARAGNAPPPAAAKAAPAASAAPPPAAVPADSGAEPTADLASDSATLADPEPAIAPAATPAANEAAASDVTLPVWFAGALTALALLGLGGLFLYLRRRQRSSAQDRDANRQNADPPLAAPEPEPSLPPAAHSGPVDDAPVAAAAMPPRQPQLEMRFEPASATLGLSKLTLHGAIHIVNHGKAAAQNVAIATAGISAHHGQQRQIDAFRAGRHDLAATRLDDIGAGKRLTLDVEIAMPRDELQSFHIQGREICVPILFAELVWDDGQGRRQEIRSASLIGPESTPPTGKLGVLRLDTGPRSFSGLGQRPLIA